MEKKDSSMVSGKAGSTKLPPVGVAGSQNGSIVVNPQVETVSPATRLLEKRRLMYEKQEQYEKKKKEFKL
jgi:hypothetical protein